MAKRTVIKEMSLEEVSFVDVPASPGARIVLHKRDKTLTDALEKLRASGLLTEASLAKFSKSIAPTSAPEEGKARSFGEEYAAAQAREEAYEATEELNRMLWALQDSIRSIYQDNSVTDKAAAVNASLEEFFAAAKTSEVKKMAEFNPCADCKDPEACKAKGECAASNKENDAMTKNAADTAGIASAIEKMLGDPTSLLSKAVAAARAEERAAVEKQMNDRVAKAEQAVASVLAKQLADQRLAKATSMVDGVGGVTPAELSPILAKLEDAEVATLEKAFTTVRELTKSATVQKSGTSTNGDASANAELETAVTKYMTENPQLNGQPITRPMAMAKVLAANPALYDKATAH